jgi:hypothetical protein
MCKRSHYLVTAFLLFLTEVLIALFVRDVYIRPYGGDFLIVIFLYCLVKAITNSDVWRVAFGVLLLSYLIEVAQYLDLIKWIGQENNKVVRVVMGTSFDWGNIIAYTLGILLVLLFENRKHLFFR